MGANLITLAEYKAYIGITSDTEDAKINVLIPIVSSLAKNICRRTFVDYVNDAKIEIYSGGQPKLLLEEYPVLAVSSVEYSADYGKTYISLVEYIDYAVDLEDGTVVPVGSTEFPRTVNGYKVTYTAGFESAPPDIKVAVMDLLTYYIKNDMAVKSQRDSGSNTVKIEYILSNSLPAHIARVFDLYKANVS